MDTPYQKELHIGLLGFGSMGRTHTWAVQNLPFFYGSLPFRATTVGVCTTSMEKSQRVASEFQIAKATANEGELINDPAIDIIDICTPNIAHFETLKKAIRAGKHVLCEKPLCINPTEAREILSIPKREGQILGMTFNYRWMAPVLRAKQLVDEGRLGRILSFRAAYLHSSATDTAKRAGWKQDRSVCGGGVLFDLGSHAIDLMNLLCGRIVAVSGMSQIAYPTRTGRNGEAWQTNADESFSLLAVTEGGAQGTVTVGKLQVGTNDDLSFEIYGEDGALRFSLMEPDWLYFYDNKLPDAPLGGSRGFTRIECVGRYPNLIFPSPKAPAGWLYGHLASMHAFLSAVAEEKEFFPSFEEGAYVQAVMDAAYRSSENGCILTEVTPCL
jgi:predicted dehydrogenase